MALAPSGEQIELSNGDQRAVVVEVGGGLRSYSIGERAVLDGYALDELCTGVRGQPLIPWPNRVRDGRYVWEGEELQLDISEPALNNSIHGLVRWRNWRVRERESSRVVLGEILYPTPGYPFTLDVELTYELLDDGLSVTASATNVGNRACPYGVGFHPYLRLAHAARIDDGLLTLPAAVRLRADERFIPYSREVVDGGDYDFRAPRRVGATVIDTCFTELERDADGLARVVFESGDGSARLVLWVDAAYRFLMVFSGDTLAPGEQRRGLALEPMSCAPNALQSGEGLARLEPGESYTARWGLAFA
jgi:aldose 1-epimerase